MAEIVVRVKWGKLPILGRLVAHMKRDTLKKTVDLIYETMKQEAPVHTGRLRDSIRVEWSESEARIGPTVPYAKYVICWTRPSPGRYVPKIGKRLVNPRFYHARSGKILPRDIGMHPGTPANPFVERTYRKIIKQLPRLLEAEVEAWLR